MYNMKKILLLVIIILLVGLSSCNKKTTVINNVINQTVDVEDEINIETLDDVLCNTVEIVEQCVVGIKAVNNQAILKTESFGSGVIISNKQNKYYVVTNRHVIMNKGNIYDNIDIYLGSIDLYIDAALVSYNEYIDLALLEVETDILLKVCELGDNNELKKGKFCIAVGSPYDLETYYNTVSVGNISSVKRFITESNYFHKEVTNEYIQSTASINEGCSGGGLFNLSGELIGINTWKLIDSSTNIDDMNFSISVDKVKEVFTFYLH